MDKIIYLLLLTRIANAEVKDLRLRCLLGEYRGAECPLDGGWSSWGPWGPCQGQCSAAGRRLRRRLCDSPPPTQGGASCPGSDVDIESCAVPMCTIEQLEELVAGDPVRQKTMEKVQQIHQKYPALLERCLLGNCYFDTVKNILQADAMQYWNSLMCVKHNVGCPVRGGWSAWSDWTRCSAVCGQGSEYHWRNCSDPPPSLPELMCRGVAFESRACTGSGCAIKKDGVWSDWKRWSTCSAKCGKGVMKRERDCLRAAKRETQNVLKKHSHSRSSLSVARARRRKAAGSFLHSRWMRAVKSASSCSGAREEMKECESSDCSVDGGWSQWDVWSPCSVPCGLGVQSRSRSCSSPVPQGKGAPCTGPTTEVQHCYPRPCSDSETAGATGPLHREPRRPVPSAAPGRWRRSQRRPLLCQPPRCLRLWLHGRLRCSRPRRRRRPWCCLLLRHRRPFRRRRRPGCCPRQRLWQSHRWLRRLLQRLHRWQLLRHPWTFHHRRRHLVVLLQCVCIPVAVFWVGFPSPLVAYPGMRAGSRLPQSELQPLHLHPLAALLPVIVPRSHIRRRRVNLQGRSVVTYRIYRLVAVDTKDNAARLAAEHLAPPQVLFEK